MNCSYTARGGNIISIDGNAVYMKCNFFRKAVRWKILSPSAFHLLLFGKMGALVFIRKTMAGCTKAAFKEAMHLQLRLPEKKYGTV